WLTEADVAVRSGVTVAALLMLIALSFILFGTKPLPFTPIFPGAAFTVGSVVISQITVVLVIVAVAVAVAARLVLTRPLHGLALLRYFRPFLVIVGLLLWQQRGEVWDVAR